jgi:hypothetical protein
VAQVVEQFVCAHRITNPNAEGHRAHNFRVPVGCPDKRPPQS